MIRARPAQRHDGGEEFMLGLEVAVAVTIVVVLFAIQAAIYFPLIEQARAALVLGTHGGKPKIDLVVHFALHGRFPAGDPEHEDAARGASQSRPSQLAMIWTVLTIGTLTPPPEVPDQSVKYAFDHGAVTYPYGASDTAGPLQTLTIRPWTNRGEHPAAINWVCGYAEPWLANAEVFGINHTTVRPERLPPRCRAAARR
jgi:hypothetical protein